MTSPTGDFHLPSAADMDAAARARAQALADKAHASASGTDADDTAEVPEYTVPYSPDPDELNDKQRANQGLFGAPGAEGSNPRDRVDDDAPQRRARWSTAITAAIIVGAALFGAAATWAYGQFVGASGTVSSTTVLDTHAGRITVEPDGTVTGPRGVVIEPDGTVHRAGDDDVPRGPVTRPAAPGEPGAGDPANTGRTAEETPDEETPSEETTTETTTTETTAPEGEQ